MKRIAPLAFAAVAVIAVLWLAFAGGGDAGPRIDRRGGEPAGGDAPGVVPGGVDSARAPVAVATAADAVRYRVVDAESGEALPGVRAYSLRARAVVGTSDDSGRVALAGHAPADLVFVSRAHRCALNLTVSDDTRRMEQEAAGGQEVEVRLAPDRESIACELRFLDATGAPAGAVACRIAPLADPDAGDADPAWRPARDAGLLLPPELLGLHFGRASAATEFMAGEDGVLALRFAARGRYWVAGTAPSGAMFAQEIDVPGPGAHVLRPVAAGREGAVVDGATGAPVAGALVRTLDGQARVRTGAAGEFALGPTNAEGPASVEVTRFGYAPTVAQIVAGAPAVRIALAPLPLRALRVEVRVAGSGRPIEGARVACADGATDAVVVTSGRDGAARLEAPVDTFHLRVTAAGFLDLESVLPSAVDGTTAVALVPATAAARKAERVTGFVAGRVLGPDGRPRAAVRVSATPVGLDHDGPDASPFLPGVLRGGVPSANLVESDADGRFELELGEPGAYRLSVAGGDPDGVMAEVVLGGSTTVDLRTKDP